jgi:hypothetical protein
MRSNLEITLEDADRGFKRQHFILADGSRREWLATEYEYTRRRDIAATDRHRLCPQRASDKLTWRDAGARVVQRG